MIRFPDQDEVSFTLTDDREHGRAVWCVNVPIDIWLDIPGATGGDVWVTIPSGFRTDGASIPWWARWALDPWARIGLAALLHDWLLTCTMMAKWDADLTFLHALRSQGVPALLATVLYFAVRLKRRPTNPRAYPAADDLGAFAPIPLNQRSHP